MFQKMRADLASMWSPSSRAGNPRRLSARVGLPPLDEKSSSMKVSNFFLLYIYYIARDKLKVWFRNFLFFFVISLLMLFEGDGMNTTDSEGLHAYFCRNLSC
jgi:hypothetical protein